MAKPGRNDPCYCGSGKKYKQCHLRDDQEAEREHRTQTEAARFLRLELPRFAREERFAAMFQEGLPIYWDGYYDAKNAGEMSEFEALRYLDWLVFDRRLDDGSRLIDLYAAEQKEGLNDAQRAMLEAWQEAPTAGAYELADYDGQILQLRDAFTGEEVEVFEAGGRGNVDIGEVILARLVPVAEQTQFSTVAAYLPGDESAGLLDYVKASQEENGAADLSTAEFLEQNSQLLIHYALAKAEEAGRPPVARLDKKRSDPPIQPPTPEHESERDRVHRQRTYGSTQPHITQTRRKAV